LQLEAKLLIALSHTLHLPSVITFLKFLVDEDTSEEAEVLLLGMMRRG